jgi:CRP/FNR family transcriptional regulator, cyclic AMP receptor protein
MKSSWPPGLQVALDSDPWFAGITPALKDVLLQRATTLELADGERLFARGEAAAGLCCVIAGALRAGAIQADGRETLLAWVQPYQWFGEISLLDGQPRTHDAVADGATRLLVVPQRALEDWLLEHPACWRDLARLACSKLRLVFTLLEDIAHLGLEQRLAKRLWLTVHTQPGRTMLRLPQEQLALLVGGSRQSVNQALRGFASRGLVRLHYGRIEVLDAAGLAALAQTDGAGS